MKRCIEELVSEVNQRVLKWLGHMERMDEYCMARRMLFAAASGVRVWGRSRLFWICGVKVSGFG